MWASHISGNSYSRGHNSYFFYPFSPYFALLADQTIPSNSFIHLYDTTPYSIRNGHVTAKIPCDNNSAPLLNILVGVAPNLTPAPLELVPTLSTPGELCLYHADLRATEQANATSTTNSTTTTTSANATTTMITDISQFQIQEMKSLCRLQVL